MGCSDHRRVASLAVVTAALLACSEPPDDYRFCPRERPDLCGGACVDTRTDPTNCGACARNCRLSVPPHVDPERVQCLRGRCVYNGACARGWGHCAPDEGSVCETRLADDEHCGGCPGRSPPCPSERPFCDSETLTCVSHCGGRNPDRCDGTCVNRQTDPFNCGECRRECVAPAAAAAACTNSQCDFVCRPGTHLCNGACVSDDDVRTCGRRCTPCDPRPNATLSCTEGVCTYTCGRGFHLCRNDCAPDQSVLSCGDRCDPCPTDPNGDTTCESGRCNLRCRRGYHLNMARTACVQDYCGRGVLACGDERRVCPANSTCDPSGADRCFCVTGHHPETCEGVALQVCYGPNCQCIP